MPHTWRVARALLNSAAMKALFLVPLSFVLALSACESSSTATQPTAVVQPAQLPAGFERVVDTSQVCMVNDQYMGKPQIPIAVEGRTYYGCCPMCKDRLANQPASRIGKDPVTGNDVDKAVALMVKDASGKILYFENEDSLRRYRL
jgi:YHS domain-containing protein